MFEKFSMGIERPHLNPPLLWIPRTPPSMTRCKGGPRDSRQNGISTLSRNFGSPFGNRMAISNIRNIFDYPSTASTSAVSAPFQRFGGRTDTATKIVPFDTVSKGRLLPTTRYTFGSNHNTGYNTVHVNHPVHKSDGDGTSEEYEDLDYYQCPPLESPLPNCSQLTSGNGHRIHRNLANSSPKYHMSSTATMNSGIANDNPVDSELGTSSPIPSTPPSFIPRAMSNSALSLQKDSVPRTDLAFNEAKNSTLDDENNNKKQHKTCFGTRRKRICVTAVLLFLTLMLAAVVISYVFYVQRGHNINASLSDFLRDSALLFQQKRRYPDLWERIAGQNVTSSTEIAQSKAGMTDLDLLEEIDENTADSFVIPKWSSSISFRDYSTTAIFGDDFGDAPSEEQSRFIASDKNRKSSNLELLPEFERTKVDNILIEPRHLLTLQITRRKICLFEVSTSEQEQSRRDFRSAHIPNARLLFYSSLSHNGVPVHPLQFQRYARSLGIDQDCRVILYDRGQLMWSAYAFWIFQLYGHAKVSLLNGGFEAWQTMSTKKNSDSTVYRIEGGSGLFSDKAGNFHAGWNPDIIATFDDVLATFEANNGGEAENKPEIIDAQTAEEFEGKTHSSGVIFGHIRGAINILTERLYDSSNRTWICPTGMAEYFRDEKALVNTKQPLIIYDGTSLRAAMVWVALQTQGYTRASIYFGSWPEWVIRAPDYLKVIPDVK